MSLMKFIHKCFDYIKRVDRLTKHGWYRNLAGGYTDSHCMQIISRKDLFNMSEYEFEMIK